MEHLESPLTYPQPQGDQIPLGEERKLLQQDSLSGYEYDIELSSDDEDELLHYAIMLSLQDNSEAESSKASTNNWHSKNDISSSEALLANSLSGKFSKTPSYEDSIITQSSRLLSLPQELKEMICSYVFLGEDIVVKPGKDAKPKFFITWGKHLSALLVCREINAIAKRYLNSGEVILDLRQFRRTPKGSEHGSTFTLEDFLSGANSLRWACSRLMIRQGQTVFCDNFELLLPSVKHVELYDYKSCREILRESGYYSGRIFEYAVPRMVRPRAAGQLRDLQDSLEPVVCADVIYVCDTLVCIPKHDPGHTYTEHGSCKDVHTATTDEKGAEGKGLKVDNAAIEREHEKREDRCNKSSRYKTAKLVSLNSSTFFPY